MSPFLECSPPQAGRAILLSIKPKYSDLILSSEKRVEFRRTWAAEGVKTIVIYASSPIQKIVALVEVEDVIWGSSTALWSYCVARGGALTRRELFDYFEGKKQGCAVLLGALRKLSKPISPGSVLKDFTPPQSFRYLTSIELGKIEKKIATDKSPT